ARITLEDAAHRASVGWMPDGGRWIRRRGRSLRAGISRKRHRGPCGPLCGGWIHCADRPGGEPFPDNFGVFRTDRGSHHFRNVTRPVHVNRAAYFWRRVRKGAVDMNEDGKGKLELALVDVHHDPLDDKVDITLRHTVLSEKAVVRDQDASAIFEIPGLDATQGGIHSVLIFPARHRPVSQFVTINEGKTTSKIFVLPIDSGKVVRIAAPEFGNLPGNLQELLDNSPKVEGLEGKTGADLYAVLSNIQKAGLLNIHAKMQHTAFDNKRTVFSYTNSLRRIRGDRFFAAVDK